MSGRHAWLASALAAIAMAGMKPAIAAAQHALSPDAGRFELLAAGVWTGSYDAGAVNATETSLDGPFTLFKTSAALAGAGGGRASAGFRLTPGVTVEAGVTYRRPDLRVTITGDAEATGETVTVSEDISEYIVDGSVLYWRENWAFAEGRARPFVVGGGGYVRHLHEGATVVDTGWSAHAGGGLKYYFRIRPDRFIETVGIRADLLVVVRNSAVSFEKTTAASPSAAVGCTVGF